MLFTRELAEKSIPFSEHVMYDQWLGMVASALSGISYIDKTLVQHRIHATNTHNNFELNRVKKRAARKKLTKSERYLRTQKRILSMISDFEKTGVKLKQDEDEILGYYSALITQTQSNFANYKLLFLMRNNPGLFFGNQRNITKRLLKAFRGNRFYKFLDLKMRFKRDV